MVNQYIVGQRKLLVHGDLAGESPFYIYWSKDKALLLYSTSIKCLLDDIRVPKPLKVSNEGLSFLLQSGVVPPPKTAYQDIYIVSLGDTAEIKTVENSIEVSFKHEFPFMNANRLSQEEMQPNEDLVLQILAEATISRIDQSKPSFLFHSAGKDSNSIALALAEAGWQDKVTLITHKSKGGLDESEISLKIAKQLGFNHQVLYEVDQLQNSHKQAIDDYFINAPFPCTDNVTLAYPLYIEQVPELKGSNLIFGDGNDSHMMSPPNKRQEMMLSHAEKLSKFRFARKLINSENRFNTLLRTPAEWFNMSGLSYKDSKKIFSESSSVYPYWRLESDMRKEWDVFDFKSDIYSARVISEKMIRKLRNFSDVTNSELILPFADHNVTDYFAKMPEAYLFDRKLLKNKLVLRDMLKNRMDLDSDAIGKMGWSYDSQGVVLQNWDDIIQEIQACTLWDPKEVLKFCDRLKVTMQSKHKYANLSGRLIYRIYLLSGWANRSKYLNG